MAKEMTVEVIFFEEVLGGSSSDPDIYDRFIASKAPDAPSRNQEITALIESEGIEEAQERSMTVFPRDEDGNPIMWDYQVRGFFKDACGALRNIPSYKSSKVKAYKKMIDNRIFVLPRKVQFKMYGDMGVCQRPLRASTAQGERVTLASSETIPAGSRIKFTVRCLLDSDMELVKEWLDYGQLKGMGQWRNSGKGRFEWVCMEERTI